MSDSLVKEFPPNIQVGDKAKEILIKILKKIK